MNSQDLRYVSIDAIARIYRDYRPWAELRNIGTTASWLVVAFGVVLLYTALQPEIDLESPLWMFDEVLDGLEATFEDIWSIHLSRTELAVAFIAGAFVSGLLHVYLSLVLTPRAYLVWHASNIVLPLAFSATSVVLAILVWWWQLLFIEPGEEGLHAGQFVAFALCLVAAWLCFSAAVNAIRFLVAPPHSRRLGIGARPTWSHPLRLRASASGLPIGLVHIPGRWPARLLVFVTNLLRAPLALCALLSGMLFFLSPLEAADTFLGESEWTDLWEDIWMRATYSDSLAEFIESEHIYHACVAAIVILAAWLAGSLLARFARRLFVASFDDLVKADPRPPLLFLRPFRDDQGRLKTKRGSLFDRVIAAPENGSIDEILFCDHYFRGPVVAIGNTLPVAFPFGAVRVYPDKPEDWFSVVVRLAARSAQCILVAETSDGVRREAVLLQRHAKKSIVLSSPQLDTESANTNLRVIAALVFSVQYWPAVPPGKRIVAVFPTADGLQLLLSSDGSAEAYKASLRVALYLQLGAPDGIVGEGPDRLMPML